jgi:uncharacterized membrane protein YraQ (UPF0718 family)/regulator of protease activity HflC (stomatin/prohibitin superfamily)
LTGFLRFAAVTLSFALQLFAKSSGYLMAGLITGGLFHRFLRRSRARRNLATPGFRSITSGLLTGMALPICSCGTLPMAVELKRQQATRESIAAFVISTPEDSPDAVFLTAGFFGWLFALVRVVAGLLAAVLGAVLVIAAEAWGPDDVPAVGVGSAGAAPSRALRSRKALPRSWRLLEFSFKIGRRRLRSILSTLRAGKPAGSPPVVPGPETTGMKQAEGVATGGTVSPLRRVVQDSGRALQDSLSYGFRDLLDEIAWPLLFGFLVSGILAAFLPDDLAVRIPGGLAGQFVFAALIAVPLNVCASGTVPLAAVLVSRGLFPAAALVIFLTGPLTNPASLLLFRRQFGRKFIHSLLISCFSVSLAFGFILHAARRSLTGPGYAGEPILSGSVSAAEVFCGVVFGAVFVLALLRVGWSRGRMEILEAAGGIVPQGLRRTLRTAFTQFRAPRAGTLAGGAVAVAALIWALRGFAIVPQGSVALRQTLGRVSRTPLPAGWRWSLPPPLGALTIVPAMRLLKVDVGFRAAPVSETRGIPWDPYSEFWHSVYTTTGDNPGESSFTAGDQNLVEIKATLHLLVTDPYQLAIRTRDGVDAVRPPFLSVMSRLLATRDIDRSLTEGRGELEDLARRQLQRELDRGVIPLTVCEVNILDFHPPQETVSAFRDVGSAAEEKERRIYEARGKLESALPLARGEAATKLAAARSEKAEKTLRTEGESRSFELQAAAARSAPPAARIRSWWGTIERALGGRPKIIVPANAEPEVFDLGGLPRSENSQKGPPSQ